MSIQTGGDSMSLDRLSKSSCVNASWSTRITVASAPATAESASGSDMTVPFRVEIEDACGSYARTVMPSFRHSSMTRIAGDSRVSAMFRLKERPRIATVAPAGVFPASSSPRLRRLTVWNLMYSFTFPLSSMNWGRCPAFLARYDR